MAKHTDELEKLTEFMRVLMTAVIEPVRDHAWKQAMARFGELSAESPVEERERVLVEAETEWRRVGAGLEGAEERKSVL